MFNLKRYALLFCAVVCPFSAVIVAAELVVTERNDAVYFVLSGQQSDEIVVEKSDFSLIYGLDVTIYKGKVLYSLAGQDIDFVFPEVTVLSTGVLVGRSITKRLLANMFHIEVPGHYLMVSTLCLSEGVCLDKVETQLRFSKADLTAHP